MDIQYQNADQSGITIVRNAGNRDCTVERYGLVSVNPNGYRRYRLRSVTESKPTRQSRADERERLLADLYRVLR